MGLKSDANNCAAFIHSPITKNEVGNSRTQGEIAVRTPAVLFQQMIQAKKQNPLMRPLLAAATDSPTENPNAKKKHTHSPTNVLGSVKIRPRKACNYPLCVPDPSRVCAHGLSALTSRGYHDQYQKNTSQTWGYNLKRKNLVRKSRTGVRVRASHTNVIYCISTTLCERRHARNQHPTPRLRVLACTVVYKKQGRPNLRYMMMALLSRYHE